MAVQLSVTVRANLVSKKFENLAKEIPDVGAGRLRGRLVSAHTKLIRYPPELPNQRYRRTGTYRRAWKIVKVDMPSGKGYRLTGRAVQKGRDYTKYVSGSAYGTNQARIHQGRWLKLRDAADEAVAGLPQEISQRVKMVSRRQGF
jgi:hypothetical protein